MNNGQKPATKQDLASLKGELLEGMRETIRDSETRLLKALYSYADGAQIRFTNLGRLLRSIRDRLSPTP